ncbi:MAG: RluA family pseudouridine synthase [Clostridia bacterium]|nr:RluA family pseudouridine synthase [Clostridia bacterium]
MEKYVTYTVSDTANLERKTVYHFLKSLGISEHFIKALRKNAGNIVLNGNVVNINAQICDNDTLQIVQNPAKPNFTNECDGEIEVVFEDDDFLIVNKPHNLACIPTKSHFDDNLGGRIVKYMHKTMPDFVLRIINRLDKDTSGIVIVAKNAISYNSIRDVRKEYHALCHGNLPPKPFTIDSNILTEKENGINKQKRVVSPLGKRAITHVTPLRNYEKHCLVSLTLETGRTHQIRVHMSSIGHALLGDKLYSTEREALSHAFLCLKNLTFFHPTLNKTITLSVPYPDEWRALIK